MSIYFDLIARRKSCLFKGDEEQAAFLLEMAEKLVEEGVVSDGEMVAAAYI
jgi:hypothetical protein